MVSGSTLMKMKFPLLKERVSSYFQLELTLTQIRNDHTNNWVQLPNGGWARSGGALPLVGTPAKWQNLVF